MKIAGIILAAGSGSRMNSKGKKQFINIYNKPMIAHSLIAFQECELIDSIFVVSQPEDVDKIKNIAKDFGISKLENVVCGGKTRSESSLNGVRSAVNYDIVAVHDAARPFISPRDLNNVIESGIKTEASVLASPIYDTIASTKLDREENTLIERVKNRDKFVKIQTPQVFNRDSILEALEFVYNNNIDVTDDASALMLMKHDVHVVMGSRSNIKITCCEDLGH